MSWRRPLFVLEPEALTNRELAKVGLLTARAPLLPNARGKPAAAPLREGLA